MKDKVKLRIKELVPDAKDDFGLAVVLRAINKVDEEGWSIDCYGEFFSAKKRNTLIEWDLLHDNYDLQSEEVKSFIRSLILDRQSDKV